MAKMPRSVCREGLQIIVTEKIMITVLRCDTLLFHNAPPLVFLFPQSIAQEKTKYKEKRVFLFALFFFFYGEQDHGHIVTGFVVAARACE